MSAPCRNDDEELRLGGARGPPRSKPRFSFTEVKLLLEAVKRNRDILLKKFNQGVSAEAKKQTWTEITNQINALGENHREVRQIMKKWADLKCDGKRRLVALRGPNGSTVRKKTLGPVERMVHKILIMSPRGDGDSDADFDDDDISKLYSKCSSTNSGSLPYLNLTDNYTMAGGDISPLSSPDKELSGDPFHSSSEFDLDLAEDGDPTMDFDDTEDSLFSSYPDPVPPLLSSLDPLPDHALLREKPVHTYSRNSTLNQHTYSKSSPGPSSVTSDADAATSSAAAPPSSQSPTTSNGISSSAPPPPLPSSFSAAANDSTSQPSSTSTAAPPPPPAAPPPVNSNSHQPSPPSFSKSSDPLPMGASSRRARDHMVQVASQSLQQQQASRMLLASVSQSLETLAQSVQLLVEAQQEFVQESLMMQRETVDILRDFSNTALAMLRDKGNAGQPTTHHPPSRF